MQIRARMGFPLIETNPDAERSVLYKRRLLFASVNRSSASLSLKEALLAPLRELLDASRVAGTRNKNLIELMKKSDEAIAKRSEELNSTVAGIVCFDFFDFILCSLSLSLSVCVFCMALARVLCCIVLLSSVLFCCRTSFVRCCRPQSSEFTPKRTTGESRTFCSPNEDLRSLFLFEVLNCYTLRER